MRGWISTTCPIWDNRGYEIITQFIKELAEADYSVSDTIIIHDLNTRFEADKKYYNKTKQYHPEWFVDIEPTSVIEFFVRDYNSPVENKIIQKALSLKPNKITEGCGMMKLHIEEKNGYPDNNFTEEEYMSYIKDIKKQLVNAVNNFERLAAKQLEINERGDYNSILTAEDEEELFKRCALIHSANNFLYICDIIQKR